MTLLKKVSLFDKVGLFKGVSLLKKGISLGLELVVNGGFDADTDWTKDANSWIISGGKVTYGTLLYPVGAASELKQAIATPENSKVFVIYDVVENTLDSGGLLLVGGASGLPPGDLAIPSAVGHHVIGINTATFTTSQINFTITGAPSSGVLSLDNVSVREIL